MLESSLQDLNHRLTVVEEQKKPLAYDYSLNDWETWFVEQGLPKFKGKQGYPGIFLKLILVWPLWMAVKSFF